MKYPSLFYVISSAIENFRSLFVAPHTKKNLLILQKMKEAKRIYVLYYKTVGCMMKMLLRVFFLNNIQSCFRFTQNSLFFVFIVVMPAPFQNKSIDFLSDDFSIKYSNHIRISILYIHSVGWKGGWNLFFFILVMCVCICVSLGKYNINFMLKSNINMRILNYFQGYLVSELGCRYIL